MPDKFVTHQLRKFYWRARRAARAADLLDRLVDDQLPLVAGLSERSRRRVADHLAEVVCLSSAYRAYAEGRIGRAELTERARVAIGEINSIRDNAAASS